jgi:hypothetical protein
MLIEDDVLDGDEGVTTSLGPIATNIERAGRTQSYYMGQV